MGGIRKVGGHTKKRGWTALDHKTYGTVIMVASIKR